MYCDKKNKCEDCKMWTKMFSVNEQTKEQVEEWKCKFEWNNILLVELNNNLKRLLSPPEPEKEEKKEGDK